MTPRQSEALEFIRTYQRDHAGIAPSMEEIAVGLGLAARSNAHSLISALERRGRIAHTKGRYRDLTIVDPTPLASASIEDLRAELARREKIVGCGRCGLRTEAPGVRACTEAMCPIRVKRAA